MAEFTLFIIIGAVAVAAAAAMLLTDNAVHSALFLILNFACVAFLFLMLDAAFLAMVQIAVYAGAIMVLFLFVIMLLGAEKAEVFNTGAPRFPWLTPVAVLLSLVFLLTLGATLLGGDVDALRARTDTGQLRVGHFAPEVELVDVRANETLLAANLRYRDLGHYVTLPAGVYTVALFRAGTDEALLAVPLTVDPNTVQTAIAHGFDDVTVSAFAEDLSAPPARQGRVLVFNALLEAVTLQDIGAEFNTEDDRPVLEAIAPGAASEAVLFDEGPITSWRFIPAADPATSLFRVRTLDVTRDANTLLVVSPVDRDARRALFTTAVASTPFQFGSPEAVGAALFTGYVLPIVVVSLVLLAALVGVIVLSQPQERVASTRRRTTRRRVSRPLSSVIANQTGAAPSPDLPQLTASRTDEPQTAGD